MLYKSTRGKEQGISFQDVLFSGLATDGGLYIPESLPNFDPMIFSRFGEMSYEQTAFSVLKPFIGDFFSDRELELMTYKAYCEFRYADRCKLVNISDNHKVLELFHGPTYAFKDFAMQMIAQMFNQALVKFRRSINIIVATSGDTGAAAVHAFRNLEFVNLFVLFPKGRISETQRRQMTTEKASNVSVISVDGNFDDCQSIVKSIFADIEFSRKISLTGVNSINWARIMSQVVYYVFAASRFPVSANLNFCVPTGNFGNIYAGYIAKKLGANIHKLIIATNKNDILHRTLSTGHYSKGKVFRTSSPSMDIQISSNFERILYDLCNQDPNKVSEKMSLLQSEGSYKLDSEKLILLKEIFFSGTVTEPETLDEIQQVFSESSLLVCPHTAVGTRVSKSFIDDENITVSLATAHPAKFSEVVQKAINKNVVLPSFLQKMYDQTETVVEAPNNANYIKKLIERGL